MIGTLLCGYELTQKLGEGGTGETYVAVHRESGQRAAVKVLFAPFSSDAELLKRYFAEVRASSQVNHVGIADLYDCGVHTDGRAFVIMELLDGKTLTDSLIELGSVTDVESLADIGWQLATLLAAVHAGKLVHGALKPDAIFLTFPAAQAPRPLVKLLDFGMAKFSLSVRHSQTGSLLGAPLYMSPEVARGLGNADHRADIYALGCILFELACGRPPFVREGKGELLIAHATEVPPPVSSLEPTIPQPLDALVGRMLTKNPGTRPQSMAEVATVLERFFSCPAPALAFAQPSAHSPASGIPAGFPPTPVAGPAFAPVLPVATPMVTPIQVAASLVPSPARRQDPTALLPPPQVEPNGGARSPLGQTWISRVQQKTALLPPTPDPPLANAPSRRRVEPLLAAPSASSRRRDPGTPSPARHHPISEYVSVPIVVATAAVIVAIGSAFLILRARKPPPALAPRPPLVAPRPATESVVSPPPPQAEPPSTGTALPMPPGAAAEKEPPVIPRRLPAGGQTKSASKRLAPHW